MKSILHNLEESPYMKNQKGFFSFGRIKMKDGWHLGEEDLKQGWRCSKEHKTKASMPINFQHLQWPS